jgi:hypothetical protein
LHPERAKKYNYCMAPECQEKNLKGLTMVAVGVNKAADQYLILDERTRDELASGKFHDQRRGSFGTSSPSSSPAAAAGSAGGAAAGSAGGAAAGSAGGAAAGSAGGAAAAQAGAAAGRSRAAQPARRRRESQRRPVSREVPRRPWSRSQEKLALLYNEQGLRPDEIAQKLGLSTYTVTQIILASRNQGKL